MKKISEFLSENFHFLVVKFSVYLNRLVFVMFFSKCLSYMHFNKIQTKIKSLPKLNENTLFFRVPKLSCYKNKVFKPNW